MKAQTRFLHSIADGVRRRVVLMTNFSLLPLLLVVSALGDTFTYSGDFTSLLKNPERGFHNRYEIINDSSLNQYCGNTIAGFNSDMIDRTFSRAKAGGNTLIHSYIHLDKFTSSKDLPQTLLDNLSAGCAAIRTAGLKIVLRPAYAWDQSPSVPESLIVHHMEQLYATISANADVVLHLEAGWIGPWGEWHDALYCTFMDSNEAKTRYRLIKKILATTPSNIPVCIRYPIFIRELHYMTDSNRVPSNSTPFSADEFDRIGFHDDGFLADAADCGTYDNPSWIGPYYPTDVKRQWTYAMQTSKGFNTMMGGETMLSTGNDDAACVSVQSEMSLLHTSELNEDYAPVNVDIWKNANLAASGNDPAETGYTRLKRKMGYRLRLIDATFPTSVTAGGNFTISANLNNDGYAGLIKPRPLYLVFDGGAKRYDILLANVDVRSWKSGPVTMPTQTVTAPKDMPAGVYKLALWLPDSSLNLRNRPAYSVRFANSSVWDTTAGYNVLSNSVHVGGANHVETDASSANRYVTCHSTNRGISVSWAMPNNTGSGKFSICSLSGRLLKVITLASAKGSFTWDPKAYGASSSAYVAVLEMGTQKRTMVITIDR